MYFFPSSTGFYTSRVVPISGGYITRESQPKPSGMSTVALQGLVDPIHNMEDHDFALLKRESLAVAKNCIHVPANVTKRS